MESLDVLTSGELLSPDSSEYIDESVLESDTASESEAVSESDAASEEDAALASDQVGSDPAVDLESIVLVLEEIHSEVFTSVSYTHLTLPTICSV